MDYRCENIGEKNAVSICDGSPSQYGDTHRVHWEKYNFGAVGIKYVG